MAAAIGIIGGSGLYEIDGFEKSAERVIATPFGDPSDSLVGGMLGGREVWFLPRHGRGHRLLPTEINHRANLWALREVGVRYLICVTAVGSLKEEYRPRDIVLPDQYFDRTSRREHHTFFGGGIVGHVSFGDPVSAGMRWVMVSTSPSRIQSGAVKRRVTAVAGARVVVRAWTDPGFAARLAADAGAAVEELGLSRGETVLTALFNTPDVHNLVVCTLCSCYPRSVLGRPPAWYKSRAYRARAVRDPRGVLAEFGTQLPEGTSIRVHDSNAELRYLVVPRQPAGTEGWDAAKLEQLVTRDAMIGVTEAGQP
jgi:hypothetical protein